jgi:hypothetical protein
MSGRFDSCLQAAGTLIATSAAVAAVMLASQQNDQGEQIIEHIRTWVARSSTTRAKRMTVGGARDA